jgi:hypothetical protein
LTSNLQYNIWLIMSTTSVWDEGSVPIYRVFKKKLHKFERVYKFIQRTYTTFWTVIM